MKNFYQCEKCGTNYEDYDGAWECERSHFEDLDIWHNKAGEKMIYSMKWKKDMGVPETLNLKFRRSKDDEVVVGEYKLVKINKARSEEETAWQKAETEKNNKEWEERRRIEKEKKAMEKEAEQCYYGLSPLGDM